MIVTCPWFIFTLSLTNKSSRGIWLRNLGGGVGQSTNHLSMKYCIGPMCQSHLLSCKIDGGTFMF